MVKNNPVTLVIHRSGGNIKSLWRWWSLASGRYEHFCGSALQLLRWCVWQGAQAHSSLGCLVLLLLSVSYQPTLSCTALLCSWDSQQPPSASGSWCIWRINAPQENCGLQVHDGRHGLPFEMFRDQDPGLKGGVFGARTCSSSSMDIIPFRSWWWALGMVTGQETGKLLHNLYIC